METEQINKKGLIQLTNRFIDQIEEYQKMRKNLPLDSDGLYILLDGSVCIRNSYDPEREKLDSNDSKYPAIGFDFRAVPQHMDVIGAEKYLKVQGYTYYGNAYAQGEATVTCGFMKEESLYLLPFYDLYQLKQDLEHKYTTELPKTKDRAQKYFKKVLREIALEYERTLGK